MAFPGKPFAPFTWSYSALVNYETCPKRYFEYNLQRSTVEPESEYQRAGTDLHVAFDQRLKGKDLPLGYGQFERLLKSVVDAPGQTYGEQKLGVTSTFEPTTFFGNRVWLRVVLDCAKVNGDQAAVFDWKTGRVKYDITQLQISAAAIFHHMPKVKRVRTALVFVNHDQIERAEFVREDLPEIWGEILPRVKKMEQARQDMNFPPTPNGLCRRYCAVVSCPYHGKGG